MNGARCLAVGVALAVAAAPPAALASELAATPASPATQAGPTASGALGSLAAASGGAGGTLGLADDLARLEAQINALVGHANAAQANLKPVVQSATKAVDAVNAFPQKVDSFKTQYGIPENPTLKQEAAGIGRFVQEKLGIPPEAPAKVSNYLQSSPIFEQLKTPFQPQNILLAVGTAAGLNVLGQVASGDGIDLGKALGFMGDKSFWGGLVGSGIGYGVMAAVAVSLVPAGAGLLPALIPTFAGLAGSIFGWEMGANLTRGKSFSESLAALSPAEMLGQAAGSTVGLLVGAKVGVAVGSVLGSFAGPVGAIAGAVLMGKVGAAVGSGVKKIFTEGDASDVNAALEEAGVLIGKLKKTGEAISEIKVPTSLPAASLALDGTAANLKAAYQTAHQELRQALDQGDQAKAQLKLRYLQDIAARYQATMGASLAGMSTR